MRGAMIGDVMSLQRSYCILRTTCALRTAEPCMLTFHEGLNVGPSLVIASYSCSKWTLSGGYESGPVAWAEVQVGRGRPRHAASAAAGCKGS